MMLSNCHASLTPPRGFLRRRHARYLAALFLALGGVNCASSLAPATGDLSLDLRHKDPRIRIDAAIKAVTEQRLELVAQLIENLSDRDGAVRMFSAVALRKLTARDFGYKPHGSLLERQEAVERWRAWLADQRPGSPPAGAPPAKSGLEGKP